MNNWYVITGGPCSGKSTTIEILKSRGFNVTQESARKYIDSRMERGETIDEIRSDPTYQDDISRAQIDLEKKLNPKDLVILDRAIPDGIGYYNFLNIKIPEFVKKEIKKDKYKKVFFLEPLPYINDSVRDESEEQMREISESLLRTYRELGVILINVPVMSKEDRVQFIVDHIHTK